jgi:hypothetical protein
MVVEFQTLKFVTVKHPGACMTYQAIESSMCCNLRRCYIIAAIRVLCSS